MDGIEGESAHWKAGRAGQALTDSLLSLLQDLGPVFTAPTHKHSMWDRTAEAPADPASGEPGVDRRPVPARSEPEASATTDLSARSLSPFKIPRSRHRENLAAAAPGN